MPALAVSSTKRGAPRATIAAPLESGPLAARSGTSTTHATATMAMPTASSRRRRASAARSKDIRRTPMPRWSRERTSASRSDHSNVRERGASVTAVIRSARRGSQGVKEEIHPMRGRLVGLAAGFTLVVSACGGGGGGGGAGGGAGGTTAAACTVGVSWNNYQEERWA